MSKTKYTWNEINSALGSLKYSTQRILKVMGALRQGSIMHGTSEYTWSEINSALFVGCKMSPANIAKVLRALR